MIFLDCSLGERGLTMLIYYDAIITGSCSIFCVGAVMIHHDAALFQKAGKTGLRTGSLSGINVSCLSPGAPPELFHS